jgi:hypothetical protein
VHAGDDAALDGGLEAAEDEEVGEGGLFVVLWEGRRFRRRRRSAGREREDGRRALLLLLLLLLLDHAKTDRSSPKKTTLTCTNS